jgi:hypothetical protein
MKKGARPRFKEKFDTDRLYAYTRAKNQASYRKEVWDIDLDEWFLLWHSQALFYNRGTASHNVVLTRLDPIKPWCLENTEIMCRTQQQRYKDKLVQQRRQQIREKLYAIEG